MLNKDEQAIAKKIVKLVKADIQNQLMSIIKNAEKRKIEKLKDDIKTSNI